ncbi:MAG: nuclear transport factor 2 family protein [Anaerolineae bacterium]
MTILNPRLKPPLPRERAGALLRLVVMLGWRSPPASSGGGDPAKTVEQYLTAKVASDETALRGLLCSDLEVNLSIEASSFTGLDAKIEGMSCQRQGDSDIVTCTGKIVATYGTEDTDFPLASYRLIVQEDGQWKWCRGKRCAAC